MMLSSYVIVAEIGIQALVSWDSSFFEAGIACTYVYIYVRVHVYMIYIDIYIYVYGM